MTTALPDVLPASTLPEGAEQTDVLVIGFGIAGGCAALEAARAGAKVVLLERAATYGGTSAMSGGHFYLGGGTAVQQATGHEDSAEEMYKFLIAVSEDPEPDKIRAFCDDSVEHFDWVEALGFQFERSYFPGKAVIQPNTEGLMFTGNEKVFPYRDAAIPAPRGHKVPVPGDTGGTQMVMDLLAKRCEEAGVEVRYETGATNLITDESGAVLGVAWKKFSETGVLAAKAVVVAAGGFVMNPDMVQEFTPALGEKLFVLGNTYDDGLGLRLGRSVGAQLKFMDEPFITAPFYPPSQLVTGIVVNKDGKRFVAEDSYHSRTSYHVMHQPEQIAYLIVDSAHIEHPTMPLCPFIDGWETVEEMEAALGIPTGNLVQTLGDYNKYAHEGDDPEFHKHPDWIAPQDHGPWGAYDLTLGKALYAGFTLGGMRCSVDGQVQREDGSVIDGLYAAGACAANIAQTGASYASGTQLAEGSYFGRRAGRHAASR
ncbi:FAD-binding protein [Nocardioides marmorisolisilvae]|uniref:FAD-binding protein n=1 Tax=Nocardioides marmorisolisilvae TaxID=1542737 RepID=A0A3N0E0G3_9ACTN|nr:FAD-binding protein [Nocardioides marmorisolisilvae]RNL81349.1 FAD-binding protein [Nocardioides marmorisolisilvae]